MPRSSDTRYQLFALRIMGEFILLIAVPVVVFVLLGKQLDAAYGIGPFGMIGGFVLAAIVTSVAVVRKAKQFGREYKAMDTQQKT